MVDGGGCCLITQLCLTLCDPMNSSMSGFPVLHYLLEFVHTHIHWVSDAIQPSHPLLSPSPPVLNLFQHQGQNPQSCLTLWNSMDCSLPGSSVHRILQARILEWARIPPPGVKKVRWNNAGQEKSMNESRQMWHCFVFLWIINFS